MQSTSKTPEMPANAAANGTAPAAPVKAAAAPAAPVKAPAARKPAARKPSKAEAELAALKAELARVQAEKDALAARSAKPSAPYRVYLNREVPRAMREFSVFILAEFPELFADGTESVSERDMRIVTIASKCYGYFQKSEFNSYGK
jgi:hypothetical protein